MLLILVTVSGRICISHFYIGLNLDFSGLCETAHGGQEWLHFTAMSFVASVIAILVSVAEPVVWNTTRSVRAF